MCVTPAMQHTRQIRLPGTQKVCRLQEPTSQAPKSGGGWLARMSGKPKAAAGPAKGSREGYQTHTDEIRKKYGDKLV